MTASNKNHRRFFSLWSIGTVLLVMLAMLPRIQAQGTAFTYAGSLSDGGMAATGFYDFTYSLSASSDSVAQIGETLTNLNVFVSNGVFITTLDFGPGIFTGNPLWLVISVRTNGADSFTTLSPLQPISATPYAIMAGSASNLLGTVPASQLSGVILPAQLPATVVTNTQTGVTLNGIFSGDGSALTFLNPANLIAGIAGIDISGNAATATTAANFTGNIADSQLSANIATFYGTNVFIGTNLFFGVTLATNVSNIFSGAFTGDGSGLTGLNPANLSAGAADIDISGNAATATTAANVTGNIPDSQLSVDIVTLYGTNVFIGTNLFSGVTFATNANNTFNGAFTGDGSGLANIQATSLTYSVSTNPPVSPDGINFYLDFAYTKIIWNLTTNAVIANTLNATSGDNHLEVWIQTTSTFTICFPPNANLVGTFTTNGLPITPSQGFWVMAVSQYGTNGNATTCTYAIVPPNR